MIVIVIIGILATIAIMGFSGVQAKGRDTERESDARSVVSQLEVYFNEQGTYPIASTMANTTASTIAGGSGILKGLAADALVNPLASSGATNSIVAAAASGSPSTSVYWYQSYAANGSTVCSATPCPKFKFLYTKEQGGTTVTLNSIN